MPHNKALSTIILLLTISSQLTSSQDCGHVKLKCNIPGDPTCCEGKCCPLFGLYTKPVPGSSLSLHSSLNAVPIIETISAIAASPTDPVSQPDPIRYAEPLPIVPISVSNPIDPSPLPPIPVIRDLCGNVPPCPCRELQCFEERVPPYCDCQCPMDILQKEARHDPNICGIHSPGQIFNFASCSCSCPVGSQPETGCGINQSFNQNTCKCQVIDTPSKPIQPIVPGTDHISQIAPILPGEAIKLPEAVPIDPLPSKPKVIDLPCSNMVNCFAAPCTVNSCPSYPNAKCIDNYCGGCNAIFTALNGNILTKEQCNASPRDIQKVSSVPTESEQTAGPIDGGRIDRIVPAPTDLVLSKPIKQTEGVMEAVLMPTICPKIGEECISSISRENRCCDGRKGGSTKCLYNDMDINGNKIGKCCVRNKQKGCNMDKDCCQIDGICLNGICKMKIEENQSAQSAININDQFDNFEMIKDEKNSKYIALSIPTIAIIFVIVLIICPILYYVYYKKIIIKKMKQSVRREVFHGLEINDHSDDEFADSDQEEKQYID